MIRQVMHGNEPRKVTEIGEATGFDQPQGKTVR
jgi:hypothetical protein